MIVINAGTLIIFGIFFLFIFFFLLVLGQSWKTRRLRKKYREDDDASKQGERRRESGIAKARGKTGEVSGEFGEVSRRIREISDREPSFERFDKSEGRELLPSTSLDYDGEDGSGSRKTSNSSRNFFKRIRRQRRE